MVAACFAVAAMLPCPASRFLVNAGEGTQRICVEHKIKIRKVEHVLLTDLSIRSIGGLPGLCLTAADAGRPRLSITGPEGLSLFMNSADNFIRRSGIELSAHEALSAMWHEYDDVKIGCIPFTPTCSAKRSHDDESPRHIDKSACYLFETLPILGKFDVKKAKELGVPPGPLYGMVRP
jgi:ribonuclease Z